jgi:SAM-dependent methyltransferase
MLLNKTYETDDLREPEARAMAGRLNRYARRLFLRNVPFAVNGVLRRRFYLRRFKMWEYARALAYAPAAPAMRVFDFGGGATLPLFFLAEQGCEVVSVDINRWFAEYTNDVAARRGLRLTASSRNLCHESPLPEWGTFDRIYSFCVIEHLPKEAQGPALRTLAGLLRPGGMLAFTFDYGAEAPSEWPIRTLEELAQLLDASGLRPMGNAAFHVADERHVIDKRHPEAPFTLGSLFLTTP